MTGGSAPAIPLFDLRISEEDLEAVAAVLRSGRLRAGEQVEAFEREFAAHLGVRHAIAVSSGTAALHLAYRASGIGPGDTKKRADWVKRVTTLSPAATWSSMTKRTLEKAAEYSATRRL